MVNLILQKMSERIDFYELVIGYDQKGDVDNVGEPKPEKSVFESSEFLPEEILENGCIDTGEFCNRILNDDTLTQERFDEIMLGRFCYSDVLVCLAALIFRSPGFIVNNEVALNRISSFRWSEALLSCFLSLSNASKEDYINNFSDEFIKILGLNFILESKRISLYDLYNLDCIDEKTIFRLGKKLILDNSLDDLIEMYQTAASNVLNEVVSAF